MQRAIELAEDDLTTADLYAELAFQTMIRAGMWGVPPQADLVEDWIGRTLELAPPDTVARAKALIARCYTAYDKSPELASEASGIAERLGDPVIRSYGYDVLCLTAFAAGDWDGAADWARRRVSLIEEIDDPDHQQDIYTGAFAPAVARGEFDEGRKYSRSVEEINRRLSPHHRLHGVGQSLVLEELLGDWEAASRLQPRVEDAVAANIATPCVLNERALLVCALARAYLGDEEEACRLEREAGAHRMTGYGPLQDAPRVQLALHRNDLAAVESLLGEPGVRRATTYYLSSMATHLDGTRGSRRSGARRGRGGPATAAQYLSRTIRVARPRRRARGREPDRARGWPIRGGWPRLARRADAGPSLVGPVVRDELDVVEARLRCRDRHEHGVLSGPPRGTPSRSQDATRTAVHGSRSITSPSKLPCARPGDEEVNLLLHRMPVPPCMRMPLGWPPAATEPLEGYGEVPQAKRFAHEANLEMIRIHSHFRRLIRNPGDGDDGVIGHLNSLLPAASLQVRGQPLRRSFHVGFHDGDRPRSTLNGSADSVSWFCALTSSAHLRRPGNRVCSRRRCWARGWVGHA